MTTDSMAKSGVESSNARALPSGESPKAEALGDFTATLRTIPIAFIAIVIGFVASFVAYALLELINSSRTSSIFINGRSPRLRRQTTR